VTDFRAIRVGVHSTYLGMLAGRDGYRSCDGILIPPPCV
jgi:hypothetical protein